MLWFTCINFQVEFWVFFEKLCKIGRNLDWHVLPYKVNMQHSPSCFTHSFLDIWQIVLHMMGHLNPLQSNSTQCNIHSSHIATENCMKCGFLYETDCLRNYCEDTFWMNLDILCRCRSLTMVNEYSHTECYTLTMHRSNTLINIPRLNAAC